MRTRCNTEGVSGARQDIAEPPGPRGLAPHLSRRDDDNPTQAPWGVVSAMMRARQSSSPSDESDSAIRLRLEGRRTRTLAPQPPSALRRRPVWHGASRRRARRAARKCQSVGRRWSSPRRGTACRLTAGGSEAAGMRTAAPRAVPRSDTRPASSTTISSASRTGGETIGDHQNRAPAPSIGRWPAEPVAPIRCRARSWPRRG